MGPRGYAHRRPLSNHSVPNMFSKISETAISRLSILVKKDLVVIGTDPANLIDLILKLCFYYALFSTTLTDGIIVNRNTKRRREGKTNFFHEGDSNNS